MQTSVQEEFVQVSDKLDGLTDEIREEGAEIRTEIVVDGERTREALRQTLTSSGKLTSHPPSRILMFPTPDVVYQKYPASDALWTPDLMRM